MFGQSWAFQVGLDRVLPADQTQKALASLSTRERNVLRHHLLDGLNIDQIGAIYGVHRATVSRWLGRIRELLHIRTKQLLRDCAGVSLEEFDSIVRLIRSRLDITFSGALSPTDADDEETPGP